MDTPSQGELERNSYIAAGRIQDKLWTVARPDVFTNQLDGLWAWIAMGEDSDQLVPPARVRMILKTVYENNRVTNGWATQKTSDGKEVKSDQLLQHDNTSTSPESVRPDENKFIVKGYPRPGAVWTQLPLFFFKAQKAAGKAVSTPEAMKAFMAGIFNPDAA